MCNEFVRSEANLDLLDFQTQMTFKIGAYIKYSKN
jgi:hypothetical protein